MKCVLLQFSCPCGTKTFTKNHTHKKELTNMRSVNWKMYKVPDRPGVWLFFILAAAGILKMFKMLKVKV